MAFTPVLDATGIAISIDVDGNMFVEIFSRSANYEDIDPKGDAKLGGAVDWADRVFRYRQ
ncbi:hypothetical protein [Thiocapsa imhoffii]|nr:hypothetical protein [Thiocapsa imhoffii]